MGIDSPTHLPKAIFDVKIPQGSTQSFFVTFGDAAGKVLCKRPQRNDSVGTIYRQDDNIEILRGIGKNQFGGAMISPCLVNGAVIYSVDDDGELLV